MTEIFKPNAAGRMVRADEPQGGASEMPRYRCHKEVHALKIAFAAWQPDGTAKVTFYGPGYAPIILAAEVVSRLFPQAGDYLVVYRDGYRSISPGKEFEDGYTRI